MSVLDKIKEFFNRIFKRQNLKIEAPKESPKNIYIIENKKKSFEDSLKVDLKIKEKSEERKIKTQNNNIKSLICKGDGTGIQHIKNY